MFQIEDHEIHYSKELDCTPFVSRSLEHHASDSTFWFVSTPILRENTPRGVQVPRIYLRIPPNSREEVRLSGYLEYSMPQRQYAFTNIHVFSGIRIQVQRHSSQRR
ncbi:hypothetical protein TNCV_4132191 [Trichonephila clavipes]|nr:hypothetical protein TNCV_4132191 [Trichonephila clavipes]